MYADKFNFASGWVLTEIKDEDWNQGSKVKLEFFAPDKTTELVAILLVIILCASIISGALELLAKCKLC